LSDAKKKPFEYGLIKETLNGILFYASSVGAPGTMLPVLNAFAVNCFSSKFSKTINSPFYVPAISLSSPSQQ
jgi:hypothetical protein